MEMAERLLNEEHVESEDSVMMLEPFIHQVGGRSTILMYGNNICKPINIRELAFYETVPQELKPFVPEFRGVIEVDFSENSDGYLTITAKPPHNYKCEDESVSCQQNTTKYRIRLSKPYRNIVIESDDISVPDIKNNHIFEDGSGFASPKFTNNLVTKHNPWVLKTYSSLRESDNIKKRKFILLENLASKLIFPCVMDLKMGVRQYDDYATQSKKLSHNLKVAKTTSAALGLRITGIQVYNRSLDRFLCHNKYYGRTLTPEGFKNDLKKFLQNQNTLRVNLISLLIERLEDLHSVIVKLETFRFYTSSLLILYDGNVDDSDLLTNNNSNVKTKLIDIRMIDFAHSTHQYMPIDKVIHKGPDQGYLFGLNNLIQLLKDIQTENNSILVQ